MRLNDSDLTILRRISTHTEADALQALGSPGSYPFWGGKYRARRLNRLVQAGYVHQEHRQVPVLPDLVDITRKVGLLLPNGKRRAAFYTLTDTGTKALRESDEQQQKPNRPPRRQRAWWNWFSLFRTTAPHLQSA